MSTNTSQYDINISHQQPHHTDNPEFYTPSGCNKNRDYAVKVALYYEGHLVEDGICDYTEPRDIDFNPSAILLEYKRLMARIPNLE